MFDLAMCMRPEALLGLSLQIGCDAGAIETGGRAALCLMEAESWLGSEHA